VLYIAYEHSYQYGTFNMLLIAVWRVLVCIIPKLFRRHLGA
jgi:hypothetical protein